MVVFAAPWVRVRGSRGGGPGRWFVREALRRRWLREVARGVAPQTGGGPASPGDREVDGAAAWQRGSAVVDLLVGGGGGTSVGVGEDSGTLAAVRWKGFTRPFGLGWTSEGLVCPS